MHRFYLPPEQCSGDAIFLGAREAHHAMHVLRLRRGERVSVLDGAGHQLVCEITAYDRDKVRLCVLERRQVGREPWQITLLQALPKGKVFEGIIQKATELGAHRIVPLLSQRVVARPGGKEAGGKAEKWRLVAIEAIKQCGSPWLPLVEEPFTPEQFIDSNTHPELAMIGSLQPGAEHPRSCFDRFRSREKRNPATVWFWIGPEGDFTPEESRRIEAAGGLPITLGPRVLRTETAAAHCLSIAQYELYWGVVQG